MFSPSAFYCWDWNIPSRTLRSPDLLTFILQPWGASWGKVMRDLRWCFVMLAWKRGKSIKILDLTNLSLCYLFLCVSEIWAAVGFICKSPTNESDLQSPSAFDTQSKCIQWYWTLLLFEYDYLKLFYISVNSKIGSNKLVTKCYNQHPPGVIVKPQLTELVIRLMLAPHILKSWLDSAVEHDGRVIPVLLLWSALWVFFTVESIILLPYRGGGLCVSQWSQELCCTGAFASLVGSSKANWCWVMDPTKGEPLWKRHQRNSWPP